MRGARSVPPPINGSNELPRGTIELSLHALSLERAMRACCNDAMLNAGAEEAREQPVERPEERVNDLDTVESSSLVKKSSRGSRGGYPLAALGSEKVGTRLTDAEQKQHVSRAREQGSRPQMTCEC